MPDNFDILSRAAAGDPVAERLAYPILLQGIRTYFRNNHTIRLHRCFGLPETPRGLLLSRRNYWLMMMHWHCPGKNSSQKREVMKKEINLLKAIFWETWQNLSEPPEGISELRLALFHTAKISAQIKPEDPMSSIPNTTRQLENIMKNSQDEISQDIGDDEIS